MKIKDSKEALEIIIDSSIRHAKTSYDGNYREANKHFTKIDKAIKFINQSGDLKMLVSLLSHQENAVRLSAAVYLLDSAYVDEAVKTLEDIKSKKIPGISFSAELALNEHRGIEY